ncbi:hypothetical protein AGMMS49942_19360 [Spirochaetia bacterium]|nr:hypothetical protein AGMMS49942_19360 [Spirochaetia bacterium]
MEKRQLDDLSQIFVELTEKEQEGILKVSKSLLKAQRLKDDILQNEASNLLPMEVKK